MNQFERELNKIQAREALLDVKEQMPEIIATISVTAKILKTYFEELVNAGFSEQQALEIVKAHGIDIGKANQTNREE